MKSDSCTDYVEGLKYSQAPYFPPLFPIRHLDEVWGNTKAGNEINKQPASLASTERGNWLKGDSREILVVMNIF